MIRQFICRLPCLLAVTLASMLSAPASAEVRALLIGVSRYQSSAMPDLLGPANDVAAMEALVRSIGATEIRTLRDAQVTRTSVETALQELGRTATSGDWILLYYSGHGAQAQAQARSEADGPYDQFVPLSGFDPARQDPERFIVDKDFYAWLKLYVPADARVLMVVDSCHSGSMYRAIDPRSFAFTPRLAFRATDARTFQLVARPGPRLPPLRSNAVLPQAERRDDLPNLVYIGASRDDQLALETELPQAGSPQRGVLTFALEQGLTLIGSDDAHAAADLDGDGAITIVELSSYLSSQVRLLSANRQQSAATFPSDWGALPVLEATPSPRPRTAMAPPSIFVLNGAAPDLGLSNSVRITEQDSAADFIWDVPRGEVIGRSGDLVASEVRTTATLLGLIGKWSALGQLLPLVSELPARLSVDPSGSDFIYAPGTKVTISLSRTKQQEAKRYATVFNLASDGTVQLLYPVAGDGSGLLPPGRNLPVLETGIVPPFGLDHIVSVTSPNDMAALRAALGTFDGQRAAHHLVDLIRAELKQARGQGSLGIAELYTGL
jgi:hypothetical protein